MKKFIIGLAIGLGFIALPVGAVTIFNGQQGGTGLGTAVGGDVGKVLTVSSVSPLVWTLTSVGAGSQTPWGQNIYGALYSLSGVGSIDATSSIFTNGTTTNASSTALFSTSAVFTNLRATNASTTNFGITSILSKLLKTGADGHVEGATAGTDYENPLTVVSPITRTLNALGFSFSTQNTWTGHNIFSSLFATNASSTNATTTNLSITGTPSSLLSTDASGNTRNIFTTLGDTVAGGASGAPTVVSGNTSTTQYCYLQTGTGAVSAAPIWGPCPSATLFTYFWYTTQSTSSPMYFRMDPIATSSLVLSAYPSMSTTRIVQNWITDTGNPNATTIPAGILTAHFDAKLGSGGGSLYVEFWETDSSGVDIGLITTTDNTTPLTTSNVTYSVVGTLSSPYVLTSSASRITARLWFTRTAGAGTLTLQNGAGSDSFISFPSVSATVNNFVPYTGAVRSLDMGTFGITTALSTTTSATTTNLAITSLTNGGLGVTGTGRVYLAPTTTFSGGLTYALGNVTNNLTAGDGLTRTVDDIDCDVASGSQAGCLSTTDWTTFNNSADFAFPFTTQSTWLSTSTLINFIGGVMSMASSTFQNIQLSGTITAPQLTSAILLTNGSGVLAEYAGSTCGAGTKADSISALGVVSCTAVALGSEVSGTLPIARGGTNNTAYGIDNVLYFNGTSITGTSSPTAQYFTGTSTSIASRFPYASTTMLTATYASTTNLIVSSAGGSVGCATFAVGGVLSNTGVACGSGGGGGDSKFSTSTINPLAIYMNAGDSLGIGTTTNRSALSMLALATTTGNHLTMRNGNTTWFQKVNDTGSWFMGTTSSNYATATHSALIVPVTGGLIVGGSGSSTLLNGITIQAGCFSVNGTCIGSGGTLTGAGVANRSSFWTSANNISYDDQYAWDNTNKRLGVGTSSPWAKLSIASANATVSGIPLFAVGTSSVAVSTSTAFMVDYLSNILIGTTTASYLQSGTIPSALTIDMGTGSREEAINITGDKNDFIEGNCRNSSIGNNAQCGWAATANDGTAIDKFMFMGKNNSGFNNLNAYNLGAAGDGTLLNLGGDLVIGNGTIGKLIKFFTGGTGTTTNLRMTIDGVGNIGMATTTSKNRLEVNGRISAAPMYDCQIPFLSQTNVIADQLGSATVGSFACEGNMFLDVNLAGGTGSNAVVAFTLANEALYTASGTPALQVFGPALNTLTAANNIVSMKGPLSGSATSSLGNGIAMKVTFQTPDSKALSTSTSFFFGFNDETLASVTTLAAHALPANGCLVISTSTPNWQLQCTRASVVKLADTGVASSTSAQKALLVIDQTGASVYFGNTDTANATIAIASVPLTHLRPIIGVGTSAGIVSGGGDFAIGNITVWGEDKV